MSTEGKSCFESRSKYFRFIYLDVEGAEFKVLKTVPWDKVDIEVLLIELIHAGSNFEGSRDDIHQFLLSKSYVYLGTICKILKQCHNVF